MRFFSQLLYLITAPFRWIFYLPMSIVSAPRRLMGLSLPARVAWLTAVMLLVCATVAFVSVLLTEDRASSWNYWWRWQTPVILVLLFAIPPVVYFAVKAWMEGEISQYPDIDEAWKAGMDAMAENGLDPTEMPLFLVLGAAEERLIRSVFGCSGQEFLVDHVPRGSTPLHWYATEDSVFLVCRDTSHLSRLNALAGSGRASAPAPAGGGTIGGMGTANFQGTLAPGAGGSNAAMSQQDDMPDDSIAGAGIQGTLVPGALAGGDGSAPTAGAAPVASAGGLARRDADEQIDRLRYLCRLLNRIRQPLCPLNGILTILPFQAVNDVMLAKEMPAAIRGDLDAVRNVARVRCSVTVLVSGMESERGFGELVRRVGSGRAKANRFGKGYGTWNPPTSENVDAFSAHASGAFEDWVYSLFREPDGLSRPGNAKLYALLCKIRSELRSRLRLILLNGFGYDAPDASAEQEAMLFSGCYFSATGVTEDRQAFVRNVFEKLSEMEEEVEWTDAALDEDDRYHTVARLLLAISSLLVIGMIAMFVYKFGYAP